MDTSLSEEDRQVVQQAIGVLSRVAGSGSQAADETSGSAGGSAADNHTSYEEHPNQHTSGIFCYLLLYTWYGGRGGGGKVATTNVCTNPPLEKLPAV